MKFLIITYDEPSNVPYLQFHKAAIEAAGGEYDIIYWNRRGLSREWAGNEFVFSKPTVIGKIAKVKRMLEWRSFVLNHLKTHQYDKLFVITTVPAVFLFFPLTTAYRGKYWFDIRDFTYENLPPYRFLVSRLVHHAAKTNISSPAFAEFLPKNEELICVHNITNEQAKSEHCSLQREKTPLTIGYVGGIQFREENERLLAALKNNPKYLLKYVGKTYPGCDLKPYCQQNGIENVEFLPAFVNEEKPKIYESIDLVNGIYGTATPVVRLLLPNRLYDTALFKKPILVSKGTYVSNVVEQYHLGTSIDLEKDDVPQMIEDYLHQFNADTFEQGCQDFLNHVHEEMERFEAELRQFCEN